MDPSSSRLLDGVTLMVLPIADGRVLQERAQLRRAPDALLHCAILGTVRNVRHHPRSRAASFGRITRERRRHPEADPAHGVAGIARAQELECLFRIAVAARD